MIPLTNEQLFQFLKAENAEPEIQEATQQIMIKVENDGRQYATFLRITEGPVLQIVTFLPVQWKEESLPDLARLLHLINKEVDLPGFGIDETSGTIFYRTVLPCPSKQVDEELIRASLNALVVVTDNFLNAVAAVAQGLVTFEETVKRAQNLESSKQEG